eukprot:352297-Chlamydomonas_euryale.AAC.4
MGQRSLAAFPTQAALMAAGQGDSSIAHFPTGNNRKCRPTGNLWPHSTTFPGFPRWRRAGIPATPRGGSRCYRKCQRGRKVTTGSNSAQLGV